MQIIQNVACIPLVLNPDDKRIYLNKDILRGKKILSIYVLSSTEDYILKSPESPNFLTALVDLDNLSLYFNLYDNKGNNFVRDFSFKNTTIHSEALYNQNRHVEYNINRVLDLEKSYISYLGTQSTPLFLAIYVFYQTENFSKFNDEISGSLTVLLPNTLDPIKLSDLVNYTLYKKKIKQIIISDRDNNPLSGYLDIYTKNKKRLEMFPAIWLQIRDVKTFYVDDLIIDFEKSYFYNSFSVNTKITFIY